MLIRASGDLFPGHCSDLVP